MQRFYDFGNGVAPAFRLGLATRGNTHLRAEDVRAAIAQGVNYLNWCGHPDSMSEAFSSLSLKERSKLVIAWQLEGSTAKTATKELDEALSLLQTDWIDIVTFYYVESRNEWERITGPRGAYEAMCQARAEGKVRMFGVTSHQRKLAVGIASGSSRPLDVLMLRYNAAHRGAERDVFPMTDRLEIPVITYTGLRWGALPEPTREDPPGFVPPRPPQWYRFVLSNESVAVALMAPDNREELDENLQLLEDWRPVNCDERRNLCEHGDRVYRTAGRFW